MMAPDAITCLMEADGSPRLHIFKNRQVACWDVASDRALPGYPRDTTDTWPGVLERFPGATLRGALHVPEWGPKVFFLYEGQSEIAVWNLARGCLEPESMHTTQLLPCDFPGGDFTPLAARLPSGQAVVYAFHKVDYVRWTVTSTLPGAPDPGFPRRIVDDWKDGLYVAPRSAVYVDWFNRSPAHSNKKIYFFMGDLYLRWDVPSNSRNYRLEINGGWKGWPAFAEHARSAGLPAARREA